jgi:hypothetical protein
MPETKKPNRSKAEQIADIVHECRASDIHELAAVMLEREPEYLQMFQRHVHRLLATNGEPPKPFSAS